MGFHHVAHLLMMVYGYFFAGWTGIIYDQRFTLLFRHQFHRNHFLQFYRNRSLWNQNIDKWANFAESKNIIWRMTTAPLASVKNLVTKFANKKSTNEIVCLSQFWPFSYWAFIKNIPKTGGWYKLYDYVAWKPNAFVKPIIWWKVSVTSINHEEKWYFPL